MCFSYCQRWLRIILDLIKALIKSRIKLLTTPSFSTREEFLAFHCNVLLSSIFYKYFPSHCSDGLSGLIPPVMIFEHVTCFSFQVCCLSVRFLVSLKSFYSNCFFLWNADFWNLLSSSCFPLFPMIYSPLIFLSINIFWNYKPLVFLLYNPLHCYSFKPFLKQNHIKKKQITDFIINLMFRI